MYSRLIWKIKRLMVMNRSELVYRLKQYGQAHVEGWGWGRAIAPQASDTISKAWCKTMPVVLNKAAYLNAADRILAGRFDVFSIHDASLGFPPTWNKDPKTGTLVPLIFGKTLNYRDEKLVGDIKYLWEPNRHLQLVTLAQAWQISGDKRYAQGCKSMLDSWFAQCPYPMGVNWVSSLELAVRLVNWSFTWHLLGGCKSELFLGEDGEAFKQRWLRSIYEHCHFIAGHFSLHSSANNHLLGEYMGLIVGTLTWPCWPESAKWLSIGSKGFEVEALKQTGTDGVNKEQAFYYHHEVADMMLLCGLIGRENGLIFGTDFWKRLEDMLVFLTAVMDRNGNVPMVGDADDAHMVHLSQEENWSHYRSLLATGAVLFERGDFAAKATHFDDKSRWLLGDEAAEKFSVLNQPAAEKPRTTFKEGGYYLLGSRFGEPNEVRALVDCGPLGYLSIAAHGHADALSLILSAAGKPLLIDPGTYAYHTQKKWRDYFRSTFAHNTLRVDRSDQSQIGGNFLWLRKAKSVCDDVQTYGDIQRFSGRHDGYHYLQDPVTHRREMIFNAQCDSFEVIDHLKCQKRHYVEICWHIADGCTLELKGNKASIGSEKVRLIISMQDERFKASSFRGMDEPPAGWISRAFDVKTPIDTLVWQGEVNGETELYSKLQIFFD